MRLTAIIAFCLATLAIAAPVEESSSNRAATDAEADMSRCRPHFDECIETDEKPGIRDLMLGERAKGYDIRSQKDWPNQWDTVIA
ncbi:hypothetical protein N7490_007014 [Penicillium lividum]|nr:hypothetical protein N7490_007014 [Penicillium lividum]